ncbi:MAG: YigZ family protein [Clostridiales bacterium]|nr:YigZ family protein [Clostridiales bacterium]
MNVSGEKTKGYKTIMEKTQASFIERRSEFIGYLSPVDSEEQAVDFINEIRAMHRKATHNCYCYILRENNICRYSDDGEPSGTAGIPIFEALKKSQLIDICCVVTRYFGGILLGGSGLVRAYTKSTALAINSAKIKNMEFSALVRINVDYNIYGRLAQIFFEFGVKLIDESFSDKVEIKLFIKDKELEPFKKSLIESCNGKVYVEVIQKQYTDFEQN